MPIFRHRTYAGARALCLSTGAPLLTALVLACSNDDAPAPVGSGGSAGAAGNTIQENACVSYEDFAGPFLLNWCVGCHSSSLDETQRKMAPLDVNFDTLDGVRVHAERAKIRVNELKNMPPLGGPSDEERALFAEWIECDLPSTGGGFIPPAPIGGPMTVAPPTGACADPRMPVPETLLPRCTAETHACVLQCATTPEYDQEACRNACLAADTIAADTSLGIPINCANCTLGQLLACADSQGCHDETAAFMCCIEPCAGDESCTAACNGELQAFGLCVYYTAPQCVDYADGPISQCFAAGAATVDAGIVSSGDAAAP